MNISARNRYGKSFYAACRLVYCGSVVAACHNGFGLTPDAVLFGNFKRLFIELAVIDGSPVHKADNGTAAQTADFFFVGNARNVRRRSALKSKLKEKGAQVTMCDLTATDLSYAVTSAFYCGKLVLACSTYDGGLFPPMKAFLDHLQTKGFRNRRIGLMENGSWAPAAARLMRAELEKMKELRLCETDVSLRGALNQTSEAQMDALVAELCAE